MKQNVELYIRGQKVDFSDVPDIYYTYNVTDLTNPTAIKNSYSKSISIPGTKNNNDLFGHIWNVERTQSDINFNASKKADFELYVNGNLYESGYVRLYDATVTDKQITYNITLYGGLGDFFYNLTFDDNGNELSLNNLHFRTGDTSVNSENEFDFNVSKETIYDAWIGSSPTATTGLWKYINFAPCYNGVPDDFDANKVLINFENSPIPESWVDEEKEPGEASIYLSKNGYSIGEMSEDLTEWDTRDLRSYLQRPVLRVKEMINAICAPENNGGYTVDLDSDFFNSNNPYYEDTWMTLPMLSDLQYDDTTEVYSDATLMCGDALVQENYDTYAPMSFAVGNFSQDTMGNMSVTGNIIIKPLLSVSANTLYTSYIKFGGTGLFNQGIEIKEIYRGGLICQLIAYNGDNIVGFSDPYMLQNRVYEEKLGDYWTIKNSSLSNPYPSTPIDIYGNFQKQSGNQYKFVPENGSSELTFNIKNVNTNVTDLKMRFWWGATSGKQERCQEYAALFFKDKNYKSDSGFGYVVMSAATMNITSKSFGAVMTGGGKTGQRITKKQLLGNTDTPADYITGFAKMFGLYFLKDMNEKKISILTRNNFYNNPNYKDLTKSIDRSQQYKVNPLTFDAKYYDFKMEQDENAFTKKYETAYNVEYGCQIVNTGYDFGNEHSNILDGIVYKGAIEALGKSKYYTVLASDNYYKPYMLMGFSYKLWAGDEETDVNFNGLGGLRRNTIYGINDDQNLKYYDVYPKVVFCDKSNKGTDGTNVLLFFNGYKSMTSGRPRSLEYYLTDDTPYMNMMNEGSSCWIYTNSEYDRDGNRIGIKLDKLPVFERYQTDESSGFIRKSLDFGSPRELYIPSYTHLENATLYDYFWKSFIEDLYSVNGRILDCYVRLKEKPNPEWLRSFFWFDNAIWRLNEITDWSVAEDDMTHMQFVKVQDTNNYTSIQPNKGSQIKLVLSKYVVDASGETITGTITCPAGVSWHMEWPSAISLSPITGTGSGSVTITIPANPLEGERRSFNISVVANGMQARATVEQKYEGEGAFLIKPRDIIVPYSGGTYELVVDWKDKGGNQIAANYGSDSASSLSYTADTQTSALTDNIIVTVGPYTGNTIITNYAQFYVSGDTGLNYTLGICQLPEQMEFAGSGETRTIEFPYMHSISITYNPFWLTPTSFTAATSSLTLTAQSNPGDERGDYVEVSCETNSEKFTAIQKNGSDFFDPSALNYVATGESKELTVKLEGPWTIVGKPSWVTVDITSGTGEVTITTTALPNTGDVRTNSIVFYDEATNNTYAVVTQQESGVGEPQLVVIPDRQVVPSSGGSYDVEIDYTSRDNDNVSITNNGDTGLTFGTIMWETPDIGHITVTVGPNITGGEYPRVLTYTANIRGFSVQQLFIQEYSEYANVGEDNIELGPESATTAITLDSNTSWTATTNDNWLSFVPTSGNASTTTYNLSITAQENTGNTSRTGYIYIHSIPTSALLATITIVQKANGSISVSPSLLEFTVNNTGTHLLSAVTVSTSAAWTATTSDSGITILTNTGSPDTVITTGTGTTDIKVDIYNWYYQGWSGLCPAESSFTVTFSTAVDSVVLPIHFLLSDVFITVYYNITETGSTRIADSTGSQYFPYFHPYMSVDGGGFETTTSDYTFNTTGQHIIKYMVVKHPDLRKFTGMSNMFSHLYDDPGHNWPYITGETQITRIDIGEGVEGLQTGFFANKTVETINLPSTLFHMSINSIHFTSALTDIYITAYIQPPCKNQDWWHTNYPDYVYAVETYEPMLGMGRWADYQEGHLKLHYPACADYSEWLSVYLTDPDRPNSRYWGLATVNCEGVPDLPCPPMMTITYYVTDTQSATTLYQGTSIFEKMRVNGGEFENVPSSSTYQFASTGSNVVEFVLKPNITKIPDGYFNEEWIQPQENRGHILNVSMPDSITEIGDNVFRWQTRLTGITFGNNLTTIGYGVFSHTGFVDFVLPDTVSSIGNSLLSYSKNLTAATIGSGITEMPQPGGGGFAFGGCSSLVTVNLPNGLKKISTYDFENCTSLQHITLPSGLTTIGNGAFKGCSSLEEITIPSGVTSIEKYTFNGCNSLSSVTLPNSLTTIGEGAFIDCESLTTLTIPASVTDIGTGAFQRSSGLTTIYAYPTTAPTLPNNPSVFYGVGENGVLHYPAGSDYSVWLQNDWGFLGYHNWTGVADL